MLTKRHGFGYMGSSRGFLMFSSRSMLLLTLFLLPLAITFLAIILEATSSTWWELTDFILEGRRGISSLARRFKS
jgi:hypothetical protein